MRRIFAVVLISLAGAVGFPACAKPPPLTGDVLAWCASMDGAFDVAQAAEVMVELPGHPVHRVIHESAGDPTSEWTYRVSAFRVIPWESEEALFAASYHAAEWHWSFLDWTKAEPEQFKAACATVMEQEGGTIPPDSPDALEYDAEQKAAWDAFLSDMRVVASGTYFDSWEDAELVAAGERLCFFFSTTKLVAGVSPDTVQFFAETRVEVVYTHLRDVHPATQADLVDQSTFDAYVERWAGPNSEGVFQEFTAALVYDSAQVLCPENAEFVDALVAAAAGS